MTNKERLQENNNLIKEIRQLLEDKMLVAGGGSYDKNLKIFNINEFEFDGNACTNFKGNKYVGNLVNGCIIPYSYSIKDGEVVEGLDYKVTAIRGAELLPDGSYTTSKFTGYDTVVLPENITEIGQGCFNESTVKKIIIKGSINLVGEATRLFRNCNNLEELDTTKLKVTSATTDIRTIFQNCIPLTNIDVSHWDTSNVENMQYLFNGCTSITSLDVSNFNTSKVTAMTSFLQNCINLRTVDLSNFDVSKVVQMGYFFNGCTNLQTINISGWDTRQVTVMSYMFQNCVNLKTVTGAIDMRSVTGSKADMFKNCRVLSDITLKNIRASSSLVDCAKLSNDSVINIFKELWNLTGETTQTLTLSPTTKNNIANIYVKLVPITDEMRAEDDCIDNKKPCVVCESTDEGAMTLTEYAVSKNWSIG